ncbi:MAG: helix-hairpin-helix domain-containing protein [Synergistaceae bacterium]|nr:helix-hairpin-helix domain-containing protein [Synergistaceae bacterium]
MKSNLRKIPGIGENMERHLMNIGISSIEELIGKEPEALFERDCLFKGFRDDSCVLYVFRLAVYYAECREQRARSGKAKMVVLER